MVADALSRKEREAVDEFVRLQKGLDEMIELRNDGVLYYLDRIYQNLWDIIVNGDLEDEATPSGEQSSPPVPKTAKQLAAKRNQERIKSILLLAIPDEYLLKFHNVPDAKSFLKNLVTTSNELDTHTYGLDIRNSLSQLENSGAYVSKEDINQKFLRSLPPSWSQIALIMRNKPDIDEVDIDELYNNLRVYEDELKRSNKEERPYGDRTMHKLLSPSSQALVAPDGTTNEATIVKPKFVNEIVVSKSKINRDEVIIEDWTSDDEDDVCADKTVSSVKPNVTQAVRSQTDKSGQTLQKQGIGFKKVHKIKACFVCKSIGHLIKDCDIYDQKSPEPRVKSCRAIQEILLTGSSVVDSADAQEQPSENASPDKGSTKVDSGTTSKRGQREGKAPMVEEDIQATHKTKEQMRQEEAGLEEAIKLQAQLDEEVAKQIHLDKMIAKRMAEEEALSEQQRKEKLNSMLKLSFILRRRLRIKKSLKVVQQMILLFLYNNEATKAELKRYGEELQTKTSKKQKIDDKDVPAIGEKVAEVKEEEQVKRTGKRKKQKARKGINVDKSAQEDSETDKEESVEAMNPTPLTTKSDIYMSFGAMIKDFTREDIIELYRLVMQKYGTNRPEDAYDRVLWSDLRTMFDPPLIEDAIWSLPLQQKMVSWRSKLGIRRDKLSVAVRRALFL
ncbi:hypothetical protein Tco_1123703 [Tanacetum coccineum]|uniref:CCHC-type domain-containing protein n=1 Tax=Tanacetum coccineum TaxID=301880 RepID=A0ABQ5J6W8_9ASTR